MLLCGWKVKGIIASVLINNTIQRVDLYQNCRTLDNKEEAPSFSGKKVNCMAYSYFFKRHSIARLDCPIHCFAGRCKFSTGR